MPDSQRCYDCKTVKPVSDFPIKRAAKSGYSSQCKSCLRTYLREWSSRNRERKRQMDRDYAAANRDRAKEKTRAWVAANPDRKRAADRAYVAANRERISEQSAAYRAENREKILAQKARYALENREVLRERRRQWRAANKATVLANVTFRKLRKKRATPPWLTKAHQVEMREQYKLARVMTEAFQMPFHVDHIVPICGENVCGLHVPWNLQILPGIDNIRKSNRLVIASPAAR